MPESLCVELIKQIPSFLWFALVALLIWLNYKRIRDNILPKLTGIKALGVEFSFVADSIDAAIQLGEKSQKWDVEVPEKDKEAVLKRARRHLDVFNNAYILWVDDRPENNRNERRMFRQLHAQVVSATSTQQAMEFLEMDVYDLVISDIAREDQNDKNGIEFLRELRRSGDATPVIFYVGEYNENLGTPGEAFGITNRPDKLLHLVLDVLERRT
jgi:CheY-like chemotaxis protein